MNSWSEGLRQKTLEYLAKAMVSPFDGKLHFKSSSHRFAFITHDNLCKGRLILVDKEKGCLIEFDDANKLIDAGWVVD